MKVIFSPRVGGICVLTLVLCLAPVAMHSAAAQPLSADRLDDTTSPVALLHDMLSRLWTSLGFEGDLETREQIVRTKGYTESASMDRGEPVEPDGIDGPGEWGPYIDPDG